MTWWWFHGCTPVMCDRLRRSCGATVNQNDRLYLAAKQISRDRDLTNESSCRFDKHNITLSPLSHYCEIFFFVIFFLTYFLYKKIVFFALTVRKVLLAYKKYSNKRLNFYWFILKIKVLCKSFKKLHNWTCDS